ncbi:MAG: tetratricopeptide repeat protein [Bryobacteraceae bacterium]|nr:tetratricopeptide repeat protein [Bryobacteraceae bacterium]
MAVFLVVSMLAYAQSDAAQVAFAAGQFVQARTLLEAEKSAPAQAMLARVYFHLKLPQRAEVAARQAVSTGASLPAVQHQLALYYAQSGQRALAAQWESRYADSPASDAAAPLRAALLHAELKQWKEASRLGQAAIVRQDRPEVRLLLLRAAEAVGDTPEALRQVAQLPYDEAAHEELGQFLLRQGKFTDAVDFLEGARSKFDKNPALELALGVAYYSQRRFADAASRFLRVIDLDAAVPQPYIFLAKMMDQVPDRLSEIRERAASWYQRERKNGFAPYVYARALQASGAPDSETKLLLQEALRRDPRIWEFSFELGQLLERERAYGAAAQAYQASVAVNGSIPETHYRLARVYDRLGQPAQAARARQRHQQLLATPKAGMQ